jgi:hypothetical protein
MYAHSPEQIDISACDGSILSACRVRLPHSLTSHGSSTLLSPIQLHSNFKNTADEYHRWIPLCGLSVSLSTHIKEYIRQRKYFEYDSLLEYSAL